MLDITKTQSILDHLEGAEQLLSYLRRYLRKELDISHIDVRINADGNLQYEYNDACHCHPEWRWGDISAEPFAEWLARLKCIEVMTGVKSDG